MPFAGFPPLTLLFLCCSTDEDGFSSGMDKIDQLSPFLWTPAPDPLPDVVVDTPVPPTPSVSPSPPNQTPNPSSGTPSVAPTVTVTPSQNQ